MEIVPLDTLPDAVLDALAHTSLAAARTHSSTWLTTPAVARAELDSALSCREGIAFAAVESVRAIGWIAAAPCERRAWEIHPLLVEPEHHGRGAGRRLVAEVEAHARAAGACTLMLSTSDSIGATTLHGVDLFPDPLAALAMLALVPGHEGHALGFWRRAGYALSGILPDAEGPGLHSITLAKRLV